MMKPGFDNMTMTTQTLTNLSGDSLCVYFVIYFERMSVISIFVIHRKITIYKLNSQCEQRAFDKYI